jgi:hypothetical protein
LDSWVWIPTGFIPDGHGYGLENSPVDHVGSGRVRIVYFTHGYPLNTQNINSQFHTLCFWLMKQSKKAQSSGLAVGPSYSYSPNHKFPNRLTLTSSPPARPPSRQRPAGSRRGRARCPALAPSCTVGRPPAPDLRRRSHPRSRAASSAACPTRAAPSVGRSPAPAS